eukprot:gb/GEZN01009011.1/.p1 GENE.gb/GEZN01009011.1/~~gb/GEZN01009011.1/.p1  ORF type:complete len:310 (+),score=39.67 gb/GEZN01009011.1/:431-1360(+)
MEKRKSKTEKRDHASLTSAANTEKRKNKAEKRDLARYVNKQRTLIFSSRGISLRGRHFMKDLQDLLAHSKKDAKLDTKDKLFVVNEVADMRNCNNVIFFEARKRKDLYMWVSRSPAGPSCKFLIQNLHTTEEVKLTGNCLKGSRPVLFFDQAFDSAPHFQVLKELFSQVFGTPKGHPKAKPFVDHVFSFFILNDRIWFRNYQIVLEAPAVQGQISKKAPVLVEIGPRFCLNPVRIFQGSFSGATLWQNSSFVSPNTMRAELRKRQGSKYADRTKQKKQRLDYVEQTKLPADELSGVFAAPGSAESDGEE